jgi:signal transduction histidine kinase
MGELLASRRAGRKLGLVVALLIFPVFVLWFIYFQEAKSGISDLEREITGLKLAQMLSPLLYGEVTEADIARLSAIAAAEERIGIHRDAAFEAAFLKDVMKLGARSARSAQTGEPQDQMGQRRIDYKARLDKAVAISKLSFEQDSENNFLINAVLRDLPDLVNDYVATHAHMSQKLSDLRLEEAEFRDIMRSIGKLERMRDAYLQKMVAGIGTVENSSDLGALHRLNGLVKTHVGALESLVVNARSTTGQFAIMSYLHQIREADPLLPLAAQITELASEHVGKRLEQKLSDMWRKFFFLTGIGAAFAVSGLGLAIFLFRKTLSQLDDVQQAKRESDEMANRLAVMNADMSNLNRELADKMKALAQAQDEVLKKGRMEQLGQLTATVAHELRNPLGAVRTSAFLLQRRLKGLNIDAESQFERINNGIRRCDNTITQLLDFSRTKKIVAKHVHLDDWLSRCAEDIAQQLPIDVQVTCVLGLGDTEIPFDPARLERAVANLVMNASEAMVGKGRDKTLNEQAPPLVRLETFSSGDWAAIRITDNGPGISLEHMAQIREPLFTTKNFGTGLGIPAVEQIAEQHEGKLDIQSTPGEGASFTIWLPKRRVMAEAA